MMIVEVEWIDAQSDSESYTKEECIEHLKPSIAKNVGYVVFQNNEYIIIAFCQNDGITTRHNLVIPRVMIKNIKEIRRDFNPFVNA